MSRFVRGLSSAAANFIVKLDEMRLTALGMQQRIADLEAYIAAKGDIALVNVDRESTDTVTARSPKRPAFQEPEPAPVSAKALGRRIIDAADDFQSARDDFGDFACFADDQPDDVVTTPEPQAAQPTRAKRKAVVSDDAAAQPLRRTRRTPKAVTPFKPSRSKKAISISIEESVEEPQSPDAGDTSSSLEQPPKSKRKYASRSAQDRAAGRRRLSESAMFARAAAAAEDQAITDAAFAGCGEPVVRFSKDVAAGGSTSEDSESSKDSFVARDSVDVSADNADFSPTDDDDDDAVTDTVAATSNDDGSGSSCETRFPRIEPDELLAAREAEKFHYGADDPDAVRNPNQRIDLYNIIRLFMGWRQEAGFLAYINRLVTTIIGDVRGHPDSTRRAIDILTNPNFAELTWTHRHNTRRQPCIICNTHIFKTGQCLTRPNGTVACWIGPDCAHRARLLLLVYDFLKRLRARTLHCNFSSTTLRPLDDEAHRQADEFMLIEQSAANRLRQNEHTQD